MELTDDRCQLPHEKARDRPRRTVEERNSSELTQSEWKDMQLVIPIEDTSSGSSISNHCKEEHHEQSDSENYPASSALEEDRCNDGILSSELRDQFESMKSIWRQARRGHDDEGSCSSNENSEARERKIRIREDLKRKEREVAVETALKIENEITTWQNGIADLEALLAAEEEQAANEDGDPEADGDYGHPGIREIAFIRRINNAPRQIPPQIRFPSLPPAIPTQDETEGEQDKIVA